MHFFLHNCILLYVYKTNQRSNYVNLSFVYLWNHFPVTLVLVVLFLFIFFTYDFVSIAVFLQQIICLLIFKSNSMQKMVYSTMV